MIAALSSPPSTRRLTDREFFIRILPYLFLGAAIFIAYGNVYGNDFILDDLALIVRNAFLRSWHFAGQIFIAPARSGSGESASLYRPLPVLLYLVVYQMAGLSKFCFHLLNIGLHCAASFALYRLGEKLGFKRAYLFPAVLIWALHPVQVESVAYVSATPDLLYSFFCVAGIAIVLPDFTPRRAAIASACCALGLLSKESAAVFPLLALLTWHFARGFGGPDRHGCLKSWPLWLVTLGYLVLRFSFLPGDHAIDAPDSLYAAHPLYRIYTWLATLPAILHMLLWPADLHMEREIPVYTHILMLPVLTGCAVIAGLLCQILWGSGTRGRPLSWGLLWFAIAQFPNSGILVPVNERLFEHWMYLPSAGLCIGAAETLGRMVAQSKWRKPLARAAAVLCCGVAIACCMKCRAQIRLWGDPVAFYENILRHNHVWWVAEAENDLGTAYCARGDYAQGLAHFRAAIAAAKAAGDDRLPDAHNNLAVALMHGSDASAHRDEAVRELKTAIDIDPGYLQAYESLAALYAMTGDQIQADAYGRQADDIRRRNMHLQ